MKKILLSNVLLLAIALPLTAANAQDRSEVIDRIKPVGTVAVTGQPEPPSAPAATPAKSEATAAAPAPVAEAAPAPTAAEPPQTAAIDSAAIYQRSCFACHLTGAANAPKLDDKAAWEPRIARGVEALYQASINGTANGMPPRGTCMTCSDEELKAVVDYMLSQVPQ